MFELFKKRPFQLTFGFGSTVWGLYKTITRNISTQFYGMMPFDSKVMHSNIFYTMATCATPKTRLSYVFFFCVVVSIAFLSTYRGRYLLSSSTCNRSFFCVIKIHSHWIISICKRLFCISTSPAEEGKKRSKGFFPCRLWKCLSASYDSGTLSSQGKSHWQNWKHNFIREEFFQHRVFFQNVQFVSLHNSHLDNVFL